MVSYLTRIFGLGRLDLAEDVVQDTLCRALQMWPIHGVPDNPSAWLTRVARNRAIDLLRRDDHLRYFTPELVYLLRLREALPGETSALALLVWRYASRRQSSSIRWASVVKTRSGSWAACAAMRWSFGVTVGDLKVSPVGLSSRS